MKVVSEEFCAALATVTVENCKELYLKLRLFRAIWLDSWLLEVEHYRDPVLVVISDQTIVSVRTVCDHIRVKCLLRDLSFLYDRTIWKLDHNLWLSIHLLLSHRHYWWKHALRSVLRSYFSAHWLI